MKPHIDTGENVCRKITMTNKSLDWIETELEHWKRSGLLRQQTVRQGPQTVRFVLDGRELANFSTNDYLGLAADPHLAASAIEACQNSGWGSGASPLVTGRSHLHAELEQQIAQLEATEAALLFTSGYAANVGTITALVGRGDVVLSDAKNHASIIDGCRLSGAEVRVFRHRDVAHLHELLEQSSSGKVLITTDSLFSMDGDIAPLREIADLADRYSAMLLVDEAHATAIFGDQGRGLCEHLGVESQVAVRVGTLSKALGSAGGFVAGSKRLIQWLSNRARSYVFSTATPIPQAAASLAALKIVHEEPQRRVNLLTQAEQLRVKLRAAGWDVGDSASQIVPIYIGDVTATMQLSARLRDAGFWVPGIRPPSVPQGEALLRISLSSAHTPEMLAGLVAALGSNVVVKSQKPNGK